jgi:hypothetical protein
MEDYALLVPESWYARRRRIVLTPAQRSVTDEYGFCDDANRGSHFVRSASSSCGRRFASPSGFYTLWLHTGRQSTRPRRCAGFRGEVLHGWRNRCAMCGYDGALGRDPAGLDAAHVFWHSQGGPDDADNGLALCSLHHVPFDLGALGLDADLSVRVSPLYVARSEQGERLVYDLEGRALFDPAPRHPTPSAQHVEWHSKQVFKTSG